jgi:hypothetical protein
LFGAVLSAVSVVAWQTAAAGPKSAKPPKPAEPVVCREMLRSGSNVIDRVCLTKAGWARLKREQSLAAERTVRVLQGSAYEGGAVN